MTLFTNADYPWEWKCRHCGQWVSTKYTQHHHLVTDLLARYLSPEIEAGGGVATRTIVIERQPDDPTRPA